MRTTRRNHLQWAIGIGLGVLAGAVSVTASAADLKTSTGTVAANDIGLMTFPNTRVVNAPVTQVEAGTPTATGAMRAYIDPATGQLRQQTPEEAQQIANETKAKAQAKATALKRSSIGSQATTDASADTIYGADGSIGMLVGDDAMVYQVARKHGDKVELQELNGKQAAERGARDDKKNAQREVDHAK